MKIKEVGLFGRIKEFLIGKTINHMKVKIINKSQNDLPQYETKNSAGMDLRADTLYPISILPKEARLVHTGLFLELPEGVEAQVRPRSGLALKHGITVLNSPGTIDADYRGEVGVILINHGYKPFTINMGDRIAQIVFAKYEQVELEAVEVLTLTKRGEGGFGSTGNK